MLQDLTKLLVHLRGVFKLDWMGVHGAPHWTRVCENGLALARQTGADPEVVRLFAFLHDSRRENEDVDPEHGLRSADLANDLLGEFYTLTSDQFEMLHLAIREHSSGCMSGDITVQTCWDADRLDLGRVGIRPDPAKLCTGAARLPGMLQKAYANSISGFKGPNYGMLPASSAIEEAPPKKRRKRK